MPYITTEFVTKVVPGERIVDYFDDRLSGFCLRVLPTGVKSYAVKQRVKGQKNMTTYTIGKANQWPAAKARARATEIILLMKSGIDPRKIDKERREADEAERTEKIEEVQQKQLTLRFVFEDWVSKNRKAKPGTIYNYRIAIHKHLADWLDKPMTEITPDMVLRRYRVIRDKTVSGGATTIRALRRLFNWSIKEPDYKDQFGKSIFINNPASCVQSNKDEWMLPKSRRYRIQDENLQAWADAVAKLEPRSRAFLMFLLLTGLRVGEATRLRWKNVDLTRRLVTVTETKNGVDHTIPVGEAAYCILRGRYRLCGHEEYVFPTPYRKQNPKSLVTRLEEVEKRLQAAGIITNSEDRKNYTPHALRRTFAHIAGKLLPLAHVKALLNHATSNDVTLTHYVQVDTTELHADMQLIENYLFSWINQPLTQIDERRRIIRLAK